MLRSVAARLNRCTYSIWPGTGSRCNLSANAQETPKKPFDVLRKGFKAVFVAGSVLLTAAYVVVLVPPIYKRYKQYQKYITLPDEFCLVLDLERNTLVNRLPSNPLAILREGDASLEVDDVIEALECAKTDKRVKGLVTYLGGSSHLSGGVTQVQELHQALGDFKKHCDPAVTTVIYTGAFGEGGANGTLTYYLASVFDQVFVAPTGLVSLTGFSSEVPFVRGLLDRLKVRPQFFTREAYKNAANTFTQTGFTPEHRQNVTGILEDLAQQVVEAVASSRGLTVEEVKAAIDGSPLLPTEAVERKLVDGIKYRDEIPLPAKAEPLPQIPVQRFLASVRSTGPPVEEQKASRLTFFRQPEVPVIAVVNARGLIVPNASGPQRQDSVVDGEKMCRTLRRVREDPKVKAVVVRVDSAGGSALASDVIRRELQLIRAQGTPVVVSMGGVAASGGYFVSLPANKIVAQPGTITGSIGVLFGKLSIGSLLEEIGVTTGTIRYGANSTAMSLVEELTDDQQKQVNKIMDATYEDFLQKVADGRGMDLAAVRQSAGGRVWTGRQAQNLGLVDQLGGMKQALEVAKSEAKIDGGKVDVKEYPPRRVFPFLSALRWMSQEEEEGGLMTHMGSLLGYSDDVGGHFLSLYLGSKDWVKPLGSLAGALTTSGPQMLSLEAEMLAQTTW